MVETSLSPYNSRLTILDYDQILCKMRPRASKQDPPPSQHHFLQIERIRKIDPKKFTYYSKGNFDNLHVSINVDKSTLSLCEIRQETRLVTSPSPHDP